MFMYISSSNDHNMHRVFIRYTLGFHEDRKFGAGCGPSNFVLACLWRTKPLVLPPIFVQENRSVGSCTAPSEITLPRGVINTACAQCRCVIIRVRVHYK